MSAKLGVNMSIIGEEIEVSPIYGDAAAVATFMIVVFFMLVAFGLFYLLFKELGFVQMLSFTLSSLLTLVLLCVCDVQMTSFGAMGVLLGFALNVYLHMYYINNIKSEYAMGKKLSVSVREGYTKSIALMVEMLLVSLGIGLVVFFISSGVMRAISTTFVLSLIPTAFTALFINRVLVINYNAFNLSDGAKANFTRTKEVAQDETK